MKRITLAAALAVALTAPVALADTAASSSTSIVDTLLSPAVMGTALSFLVGAVGLFAGGTWLTTQRKRRVALAVYHAYNVVEDVKAEALAEGRRLPAAEKVAEGLRQADAWMRAQGWRPLKPGEQELAKLEFRSMHGTQKAAEYAQELAVSSALGAIGSTAALAPVTASPQTPRG
jgi:hypothetical protein